MAGLSVARRLVSPRLASIFIAFLALAATAKALDIRVRVISARNGRPLPKRYVDIIVDGPIEPGHSSGPTLGLLEGQTDGSGAALLHIDSTLPPGSWLQIWLPTDLCSPDRYSVDRVVRTGVSAERACPHRHSDKFAVPAQPGQIVLYSGDYSAWERLFYLR